MPRTPKLSNASIADLAKELTRRRKRIPRLRAKAESLRSQLAMVEAELRSLSAALPAGATKARGSRSTGRPRGRPPGQKGTLLYGLLKIVGAKPMSPKQIREALIAKGLKKDSKTLGIQISQLLGKHPAFKQKARAQWVRAA